MQFETDLNKQHTILTVTQAVKLDFMRGAVFGPGTYHIQGNWLTKVADTYAKRLVASGVIKLEFKAIEKESVRANTIQDVKKELNIDTLRYLEEEVNKLRLDNENKYTPSEGFLLDQISSIRHSMEIEQVEALVQSITDNEDIEPIVLEVFGEDVAETLILDRQEPNLTEVPTVKLGKRQKRKHHLPGNI